MATIDTDPWNWDVADVRQFFEQRASGYVADLPHNQLPPLAPFLQALQDSDVTGAVLLTAVDASFLRDDCGIKSLGMRATVLRCINKLRQASRFMLSHNDAESWQLPTPSSVQLLSSPRAVPGATETTKTVGGNVRNGEASVEDEHGRKRRRLNPTTLQVSRPVPRSIAGFLCDSRQPIDDLFFGRTRFGAEIKELEIDGEIHVPAEVGESADAGFDFYDPRKAIGTTRYVYRQMRHFLSKPEKIFLHRRGRDAVAILPYRDGLQADSKPRSAAVVQALDPDYSTDSNNDENAKLDGLVVLRENASLVHGNYEYKEHDQESTTGEWDFLIQKYKHSHSNDLVVGDDGESTEDFSPSLLAEIEEEETDMRTERKPIISRERAEQILDQQVETFRQAWALQDLPRLEKTARTIWRKMKQSKTIRAELISQATATIDHMQRRLTKYKSNILAEEYTAETELTEACRNLDGTVENIEEQKWNISVWRRTKEPPRDGKLRYPTTQRQGVQSNHPVFHKQALVLNADDRIVFDPASPVQVLEVDKAASMKIGGDELPTVLRDPNGTSVDMDMDDINDVSDEMSPTTHHDDKFVISDHVSEYAPSRSPACPGAPDAPSLQASRPGLVQFKASPPRAKLATEQKSPDVKESPSTIETKMTPSSIKTEPISLLSSSDADTSKPAKSRKVTPHSATSRFRTSHSSIFPKDMSSMSPADVDSWTYRDILREDNVPCLLAKMLRDQGHAFFTEVREYQLSMHAKMKDELSDALRLIRAGKELEVQGAKKAKFMVRLMKLAVAWWLRMPASVESITASDVSWRPDGDNDMVIMFYAQLQRLLRNQKLRQAPGASPKDTKRTAKVNISSASDVDVVLSSDEDSPPAPQHKKPRRRPVKESVYGELARKNAQERMQAYSQKLQATQSSDLARLALMVNDGIEMSGLDINPGKKEDEPPIFIPLNIASKMKDHQVEGARFIWLELTAQGSEGTQGCLLAHTMGLGKTMQTIAVLRAITQTAQSRNVEVYSQLPAHLRPEEVRSRHRHLRTLILCPASLLQNWRKEINTWAGETLGNVIIIETSKRCLEQLAEWRRFGGILLLGYPLFQRLICGRKPRPKYEQSELDKLLLEAPELVVADEAHNLKNDVSATAIAASRISTRSRVALTGTPMSNDVQEIYALVSWAAPGYLGEKTEFNARYKKPIEEGTYQESTAYERRKSLKRLAVLREQIAPKVNRADITVLRGSLKSKVEFVITVPLTLQQEEAYRKYVTFLFGGNGTDVVSNTRLFSWLGVLQLLTNHPLCFKRKLLEPPPEKTAKQLLPAREPSPSASDNGGRTPLSAADPRDEDVNEEDVPDEEHVASFGFSEAMVNELVSGIEDSLDPKLSAKSALFLGILLLAKKLGDKVLVFSSRIPTLQYLEDLLQSTGLRYGRIDGSIPVPMRLEIIDKFHDDPWAVLLISTRAGGLGLNIQGANRVIIFDFGFNPTWEEQAVGRAYRLGQQKPVFVYRFVAGGTFETNIYNKQLFKSSLAQRVVDKKNPIRNARKDARDYLYFPRQVAQEDITEYAGKDPQVLDLLIQEQEQGKGISVRAIKTMETLQQESNDDAFTAEEREEVRKEFEEARLRRAMAITNAPAPTQPPRAAKAASRGLLMSTPEAALPQNHGDGSKSRPVRSSASMPASQHQHSASQLSSIVSLPIPSTMPAANSYAGTPGLSSAMSLPDAPQNSQQD